MILVVGAFFICTTMGVRQSFGLFLTPYTTDLNIGRDLFSLAIAAQNLLWGLMSPMFGALADRRGPVSAAAAGGLLYTGGVLLMAVAGGGGMLFAGQILIGMGLAGAGFSVILGTVGKVVSPRRRSMALGVVSAAGSFGQFALVPVAQWGMDSFGFRGGMMFLALFTFLMVAAAPLLKLPQSAPKAQTSESISAVLRAAFASRSYVLLCCGFFVCGFQVVFIATHMPAYVEDAGLPVSVTVTALALIGLFNMFGTVFFGWTGDVMPKKTTLTIFYLLRSLVIAIFLITPLTATSVIVFGAAIGFLWLGTVPLTSGLVAVICGTRHMSMLYGCVFVAHQLGSFFGALAGGVVYEAFGNYDLVWYAAIVLGIVAGLLHYPIKERADANFVRQFGA